MSKQIARRLSDRIVEQYGQNIGERAGCVVEVITDAQADQLLALVSQPNGGIVANADGSFSALPYAPPPAPAPDPQLVADRDLVRTFMNAPSGSATAAQRDDVLKAVIRYLRRAGQDA